MSTRTALVVPRVPGAPAPDEPIAFARERLAGCKLPRSVDFVADLPRTPSGRCSSGSCASATAPRRPARPWQSDRVPNVQYFTATTLDGYIADENHSLDWLFEVDRADAGDHSFASFFAEVGAMAMGATTYEWVLEHERLLDDPDKWRGYYGDTPCWVFTHRTLPAIPGASVFFAQGDVGPVHDEMRRAAGERNIWLVGGGDLVGQFTDRQLLDEILVAVAPVTLGRGAPLLPRRLTAAQLQLVDVGRDRQFARLRYRVRK
jgi:dihydrofolate reductase